MVFFDKFRGEKQPKKSSIPKETYLASQENLFSKNIENLFNGQINPNDLRKLIPILQNLNLIGDGSQLKKEIFIDDKDINNFLNNLNALLGQSREGLLPSIRKEIDSIFERISDRLASITTAGGIFSLLSLIPAYGQQVPLPTAPDTTQLPQPSEPHSLLPVALIFLLGTAVAGIVSYFLRRRVDHLSRQRVAPGERARFDSTDLEQLGILNQRTLEDIRNILAILEDLKNLLLEQQEKREKTKEEGRSKQIIDKINEILITLNQISPNFENNRELRKFVLELTKIKDNLRTIQESLSKPSSPDQIITAINKIIEDFNFVKSYFEQQLRQIEDQYRHSSSETAREVGNLQAQIREARGGAFLSFVLAGLLFLSSIFTAVYDLSRDPDVKGYERLERLYEGAEKAAKAQEEYYGQVDKTLRSRQEYTRTAVETEKEETKLLTYLQYYLEFLGDKNHPIHSFLKESAQKDIVFTTLRDLLYEKTELSKAQQKFLGEYMKELELRTDRWKAEIEKFCEMLKYIVLTDQDTVNTLAKLYQEKKIEEIKQELERLQLEPEQLKTRIDQLLQSINDLIRILNELKEPPSKALYNLADNQSLTSEEKNELGNILRETLNKLSEIQGDLSKLGNQLQQFKRQLLIIKIKK